MGAEQEQHHAPCPQCGSGGGRGVVTRKVETLVGEVELARPYFYCVPCHQGFAPLDATLGVARVASSSTCARGHQAGHEGPLRDGPDLLGN